VIEKKVNQSKIWFTFFFTRNCHELPLTNPND